MHRQIPRSIKSLRFIKPLRSIKSLAIAGALFSCFHSARAQTPIATVTLPPGDANALAAAMMRVMTMSNADRQAMGARGRELIQRRFSLQVVLDQWEALYADLLANRLRPKRWH